MFGFAPVARMEQPSAVPKNQYSSAINHNRKDSRNEKSGFSIGQPFLTLRSETKQLVVVRIDRYICFFLSIMRRFNGEQRQLCQNTGKDRRNTPYRYAEYR